MYIGRFSGVINVIPTNTPAYRFARPYSQLAPAYDSALGIPNFIGTRAAFGKTRQAVRYTISFRRRRRLRHRALCLLLEPMLGCASIWC